MSHKPEGTKRHKPDKQARRAHKMARRKMLKGLKAPLAGGRRNR